MTNRIERGLESWHRQEAHFASIFGKRGLQGRAFAKIRFDEMRKLYRRVQPPRNLEERVSVKMLRSANRDLERRLYPGRINRVARRILRAAANVATRTFKWLVTSPVEAGDRRYLASRRQMQAQAPAVTKTAATRKPTVVRMQPRQHQALDLGKQQSKGMRR